MGDAAGLMDITVPSSEQRLQRKFYTIIEAIKLLRPWDFAQFIDEFAPLLKLSDTQQFVDPELLQCFCADPKKICRVAQQMNLSPTQWSALRKVAS